MQRGKNAERCVLIFSLHKEFIFGRGEECYVCYGILLVVQKYNPIARFKFNERHIFHSLLYFLPLEKLTAQNLHIFWTHTHTHIHITT